MEYAIALVSTVVSAVNKSHLLIVDGMLSIFFYADYKLDDDTDKDSIPNENDQDGDNDGIKGKLIK